MTIITFHITAARFNESLGRLILLCRRQTDLNDKINTDIAFPSALIEICCYHFQISVRNMITAYGNYQSIDVKILSCHYCYVLCGTLTDNRMLDNILQMVKARMRAVFWRAVSYLKCTIWTKPTAMTHCGVVAKMTYLNWDCDVRPWRPGFATWTTVKLLMSALPQLRLHSWLNTWPLSIGLTQLLYETRNCEVFGFGTPYIRCLMVV